MKFWTIFHPRGEPFLGQLGIEFLFVRRDFRRCVSPLCGGYWVKRTNFSTTRCLDDKFAAECYVADVNLSPLGLEPDTASRLQSDVDAGTAVLRGKLVAGQTFNGTRLASFRASEGWKALSSAAPTGTFYKVTDSGIRCVRTPCPSLHAAKLNSTVSGNITGIVAAQNVPDPTLGEDGVILAGTIARGVLTFNTPYERWKAAPTPTCDNVRCGAGTHCELQQVVCITTPCNPQPVCVDDGPTCANVRCAAGTHCELVPVMCVRAPCPPLPQCLPDAQPCMKTGCSGQVCADHSVITTCEWRPEYACYRDATCARQANGACAFTQTPALTQCLAG